MNKNLLCKVPSTLGLFVDVLLIIQLTVGLYHTFKPKTKTTDNSQDNNRKDNELWEESRNFNCTVGNDSDSVKKFKETEWPSQKERSENKENKSFK